MLKHYSNLSAVERTGMLTIRDYFAILQVSVQDFNSNNQWVTLKMIMGMGFPFPLGIPWEWELMTQLGMGMGRNGNHLNGNGNGPYCSHGNKFPSADAVFSLCNSNSL